MVSTSVETSFFPVSAKLHSFRELHREFESRCAISCKEESRGNLMAIKYAAFGQHLAITTSGEKCHGLSPQYTQCTHIYVLFVLRLFFRHSKKDPKRYQTYSLLVVFKSFCHFDEKNLYEHLTFLTYLSKMTVQKSKKDNISSEKLQCS